MGKICFLIVTTIEYRDLWQPCFSLLKTYMPEQAHVYVATDEGFPIDDPSFSVIETGKGTPNSSRILKSMDFITEDFIVFMLDDYFFKKKINNQKLENIVALMEKFNIDYVTFEKNNFASRYSNIKGTSLMMINCYETYAINYRMSIWKKNVIVKCFRYGETPWHSEVRLSKRFEDAGCRGAYSKEDPFSYFHGVGKGVFYRKPYRFLKNNGFNLEKRKQMSLRQSINAAFVGFIKKNVSKKLLAIIKKRMRDKGRVFLSDEEND